jgi:hypothetical protein
MMIIIYPRTLFLTWESYFTMTSGSALHGKPAYRDDENGSCTDKGKKHFFCMVATHIRDIQERRGT